MPTKWRTSDMFHATSRSSAGERRHRHVARPAARAAASRASTNSAWMTAAIGERAPARMLVAVRASAPVAAMPPKNGRDDVADAERDELRVGIVLGAGHAVGDDRGEQRLDRAEHRDREGRGQQLADQREGERRRRPTAATGAGSSGGMPAHVDAVDRRCGSGCRSSRRGTPGTKRSSSAAPRRRRARSRSAAPAPCLMTRGTTSSSASVTAATPSSDGLRRARARARAPPSLLDVVLGQRPRVCRPSTSLSCSVAMTTAMPGR